MKFFKNIARSVYGPSFYAKIEDRSFGQALGYFFAFSYFFYFLLALVGIIVVASMGFLNTDKVDEYISNVYPDELVLNFEDSLLQVNVEEPYFITGENIFSDDESEWNQAIAVIDTTTPFSTTQFFEYQTFSWLSADSIHLLDEDGNLQTIPYNFEEDFEINEEKLTEITSSVTKFLVPIVLGLAAFMLIFMVGFISLWRMVVNIIFALILLLAAKIRGLEWDFAKAYTAGLHMFTGVILINTLFLFLEVQFMFKNLLLAILVIAINFVPMKLKTKKAKKTKQ